MAIEYKNASYSKVIEYAVKCKRKGTENKKVKVPGDTGAKFTCELFGIPGGNDLVILNIYPYKAKKSIECVVDIRSMGIGLRPMERRGGRRVEKRITPELERILNDIAAMFEYGENKKGVVA